MELQAKLDKVIIKPYSEDDVTASGIIIPESSKMMPSKGIVVAVGEGTDDEPMELSVGDKVIFAKNIGTDWEHNGENYIFMRQCDVLSIIYG